MPSKAKTKTPVHSTAQPSTGHWLVKSEPSVYGIAHLKRDGRTWWEGVRNYQARNHLRAMAKGDRVLFYHSSEEPTGIAGVAVVRAAARPDPTQFDSRSDYFDAAATRAQPRWFAVELAFERQFERVITLEELRSAKPLADLLILRRGNRLSVTPVQPSEYRAILAIAGAEPSSRR